MKDCPEYQELLSALLDGQLSEDERGELRTHLSVCRDCAAMYEAFSDVSGAMEFDEPPADLHDRVMDAVRATIPKKKAPWLLPTLSAAACFVAILGSVMILRPVFRVADSSAPETAASGAVTYSATTADAEAPAEDTAFEMDAGPFAVPESAEAEEAPMEAAADAEETAQESKSRRNDFSLLETELEVVSVGEDYFTGTVISGTYEILQQGGELTVVTGARGTEQLQPGTHVTVRYAQLGPIEGYRRDPGGA